MCCRVMPSPLPQSGRNRVPAAGGQEGRLCPSQERQQETQPLSEPFSACPPQPGTAVVWAFPSPTFSTGAQVGQAGGCCGGRHYAREGDVLWPGQRVPRLPGSSAKGQPELLCRLPSDSHAVWALGGTGTFPSGSSSQPPLSEALGAEKWPLGLSAALVQTGGVTTPKRAASLIYRERSGPSCRGKAVRSQSNGWRSKSRSKVKQTALSDCGWEGEPSPEEGGPRPGQA